MTTAQQLGLVANDFTQAPPHSIACNRFADLARDGESNARSIRLAACDDQDHVFAFETLASPLNAQELGSLAQRLGLAEAIGQSTVLLTARRNRELFAAFGSAGLYDFATANGRHTFAKSVSALAAAIVWLIRALHRCVPFFEVVFATVQRKPRRRGHRI